jgi:DNA-binding beta-propeller fold protein YncE
MKQGVFFCGTLAFLFSIFARAENFDATTAAVGRTTNGLITPVNQIVTPAGTQVELAGMRPNALALSPNGKILVTAGLTHELVAVNPADGKILQRVSFPADAMPEQGAVSSEILNPDEKAQLSYNGLAFSPDGKRIYLANVNGDIKVFGVAADQKISALGSIALPPANAPRRTDEIPAGIAVSADGKKIYVCGNLSNRLFEIDAASGKILQTWNVGVAPFDAVVCKNKIYVSNWGGRRPDSASETGPIGRGTRARVDARGIVSEGSVSVIDLASAKISSLPKEIVTGPHACALALSPNEKFLAIASAGSDMISILDTRSDEIIETFTARQNPADLFGAQPDALAFDTSGKILYCANASQNAVAVFQFKPRETTLLGLIPVGWFPGSIQFDARGKKLCVANLKNLGDLPEKPRKGFGAGVGFNTKQYNGSLSLVSVPSKSELQKLTKIALANLRYPLLARAKLPPRENQNPVPVPERAGEPSVFKHVIYIIKENRTYDQIFGDIKKGNGNADLCVFGENVTPNEHKLVREFALLDNTYCCSILSADGHNWTDAGFATEYLERSFAGWPRSYPSGGDGEDTADALAYSPAGFIWNDALAHGKTVVDFGEFASSVSGWKDKPQHKRKPFFLDYYNAFLNDTGEIKIGCEPDIAEIRPMLVTNTVGWDLDIPDQWRAKIFSGKLKQFEVNDNLPSLTIMWLPNDHTSGTKTNSPTPRAQVADNDLALGKIVEAVSHSKFWKDTCIFAIEDDPQNGWDHVSGHRTTAYVISPYTKRGAVVSTQFNTTSLLRTMELMLGLPPMNQFDATATPMFDCFTNVPDYTAFDSVPNNVPLDEMNKPVKKNESAQIEKDILVSNKLPLEKPDRCDENVLNRILWRATMGAQPYPEWAVKTVVDDD